MIKQLIHRTVSTMVLPGLVRGGFQSDGIGIIMVHGVHEKPPGQASPPRSSVSKASFEQNLMAVGKHYSFVSMDEVAGMISGTLPWKKRSLALTFDDSLKCHSDIIAPMLFGLSIPGTFYLSTNIIDQQSPYWWLRLEYAMSKATGQQILLTLPGDRELRVDTKDWRKASRIMSAAIRTSSPPEACEKAVESVEIQLDVNPELMLCDYPFAEPMTWNDARRLLALGMAVGSHTVSHPNLTLIDADRVRSEFEDSRQRIEQECALPCRHLCYPHGNYSESVCQAASNAGYITAVTTEGGWCRSGAVNHYRLPRFAMPGQTHKLGFIIARALMKRKN